MIKINLLGDSTKIDHTNRFLVIGFSFVVFLSLIFCYQFYNRTQLEISQHNLKITSLKEQLATLEKRTKVVKDLETRKAEIRKKLVVLATLRKNRMGPVKVLNDLNVALPETVWLQSIKENDGNFEIKGRALDNQNIALFIKQIQESKSFTNVDLKESRQIYYSKKSGTFNATPDEGNRNDGIGGKTRTSASVRSREVARSGMISESNVRVKEFIIIADFSYAGLETTENVIETEEEVEFPELAELNAL